jgi:hypothetical protein
MKQETDMEFNFAKPKAVKIDLVNKEITLTFHIVLNDDHQEAAENLAQYVGNDVPGGELRFIPGQPGLPGMSGMNSDHEPDQEPDA